MKNGLYTTMFNSSLCTDKDKFPQPTPKAELHRWKVMLCVWLDCRSIIHLELLKLDQTLNARLYVQQVQGVHKRFLAFLRSSKGERGKVLHHNIRSATTRITQETILKLSWSVLPVDYYRFWSLENVLIGETFSNEKPVQEFVEICSHQSLRNFMQNFILPGKWQHVIANNDEYTTE